MYINIINKKYTKKGALLDFSLKVYDCFLENMQIMRNRTLTAVRQQ